MSKTTKQLRFNSSAGDLLWGVGLFAAVAVTIALSRAITPALAPRVPQWFLLPLLTLISIGSAVAIGAEIGAILQRKQLGATIGAVAGLLLMVLFLAIPYLP
jgi:hypothetical protein